MFDLSLIVKRVIKHRGLLFLFRNAPRWALRAHLEQTFPRFASHNQELSSASLRNWKNGMMELWNIGSLFSLLEKYCYSWQKAT